MTDSHSSVGRRSRATSRTLRLRKVLPALAVLAFAGMESAQASPTAAAAVQSEVARITLSAPLQENFTVRATLPVPRGEVTSVKPVVPLSVVDANGDIAPTQVEMVSRYPNPADGADVIEVIARVSRPANVGPGERMDLSVVRDPHPAGNLFLPQVVEDLLDNAGSVRVNATDVFGHNYVADLLEDVRNRRVRYFRDGSLMRQMGGHEILLPEDPTPGVQGTLPHLMGLKTYVTVFGGERMVAIDLVIHNGLDGTKSTPADDVLNELYFKKLTIAVPHGWHVDTAFANPYLGDEYVGANRTFRNIVEPLEGNKLHFMPRQAQFVRRIMLAYGGSVQRGGDALDERHLAFCRPGTSPDTGEELWSWWNADTARYFPQRHRLPRLSNHDLVGMATDLRVTASRLEEQIKQGTSGSYPYTATVMGWAHPWSVAYGGVTGGNEINFYDGVRTAVTGSNRGYKMHQAISKAYLDRQPTALFGENGQPTSLDDLLVKEGLGAPYLPGTHYLRPSTNNGDWFGFGQALKFQTIAVAAQNKQPYYKEELEDWQHIDSQHLIRFTRTFKVMTWLGNDALSKEILEATFQHFRTSYHHLPNGAYGFTQSSGLLADLEHVSDYPNQGVGVGRSEAWGLDVAASAYAVGDDARRDDIRSWLDQVMRMLEAGQSDCTGNIMAQFIYKPDYDPYLVRQSREVGFLDQAIRSVAETVYRGADGELANLSDRMLERSVYASIEPPFWSDRLLAPWVTVPAGMSSLGQDADLCFNVPEDVHSDDVDLTRYWNSLAYAYRLTGDQVFLHKAAQMSFSGNLVEEFLSGSPNIDIEARAGLIALLEELYPQ